MMAWQEWTTTAECQWNTIDNRVWVTIDTPYGRVSLVAKPRFLKTTDEDAFRTEQNHASGVS